MRRKTIILIFILIILLITTILILNRRQKGTIPEKYKDFALKDTSAVDKVFIADMRGNFVTLTRDSKNQWIVNNKYPANLFRIERLLETISLIEIKNPVPLSARDNVIKELASMGKKVEIYTGGETPAKAYYVGGPTQDQLGTYMALDNKEKEPFVIHIPGFFGYLSDGYYFTDINDWRSRVVFAYKPTSIKTVEIKYKDTIRYSFALKVKDHNDFELYGYDNKLLSKDSLDNDKVKKFLVAFKSIYFETIVNTYNQRKIDSIYNLKPYIKINVVNNKGMMRTLYLFEKPSDIGTKVEYKEGIDAEKLLAYTDFRKEDIVIMQLLTLKRILWKFEDFIIEK